MFRPRALFACALLAAGCAPRGAERSDRATRPLAAVDRAFPLVARATRLRAQGAELVSNGALQIAIPRSASGVVHIARDDAPSSFVDVQPLEVEDAAAVQAGSKVLYLGVTPAVDLVSVAFSDRFEELRVLHAPHGTFRARWRLRASDAIAHIRLREGRVELVEASGRVALSTDPLDAVDAAGTHRVPTATLEVNDREAIFALELDVTGLVAPIVVDPAWTAVASMSVKRKWAAAVVLSPTKVLVHGGTNEADALVSSGEIYDVANNTWTAITPSPIPLNSHEGVRLSDGRVLFVNTYTQVRATHVFNPANGTWVDRAMLGTHWGSRPIGLADGKVLVIGGSSSSSVELFNPATDAWEATTPMSAPRNGWQGAPLTDGRVLVLGGRNDTSVLSSAEIYDPIAKTWTNVPAAPTPRFGGILVPLSGGRALTTGGYYSGGAFALATEERASAGTWTATGAPSSQPEYLRALADGRLLGLLGSTAEAYDPVAARWSATGTFAVATINAQALAPLPDGRALVAGGRDVNQVSTATVQIYAPLVAGASCEAAMECKSAACADGVCCDRACAGPCETCSAAGTCTLLTADAPQGHGGCGRYAKCVAGACATTCAVDSDCEGSNYCAGTSCVSRKPRGTTCSRDAECDGSFCADGVCCTSRCGEPCAACDIAGSVGNCLPVRGVPHGARPACTGVGVGTACGPTCDGKVVTKCSYLPPSLSPCSENACKDGGEIHASACDGNGACSDVKKSCGAYACGPTACKSSCTVSGDCALGFHCSAGACVPTEGLGKECVAASACASGFCTDAVCCAVASCGDGKSCALGTKGACATVQGGVCSADADCGSGHCVDGVCCDSACTGACEACDVAGAFGRCTAVRGKPHGVRTSCPSDPSSVCASKICDGETRESCAGFPGTNAICRAAACAAGVATEEGRCDGKGTCAEAKTSPCVGFACDPSTVTCRTRCSGDGDCLAGNECVGGSCKPRVAICSDDGTQVVAPDGTQFPCAPFRCHAGACPTKCISTGDCAALLVCDGASCVTPASAAPPEESGGCSSSGRSAPSAAMLLAVAAGLALFRRRRAGLAGVLLGVALVGCSHAAPTGSTSDRTTSRADRTIALAQKIATVVPSERGLARAEGRLSAPVRIELDRDFWIELRTVGDRDVLAEPRAGAQIFLDATRAVDVVRIAGASAYEELRVVRAADAEHATRYLLQTGPAVADVRFARGRVEVVDRNGAVRLVTDPLSAVDADGRDVPVLGALSVHEGGFAFDVSLPDIARRHPIVIDPAWTTAASMNIARSEPCAATLADGNVLVVGGNSSSGVPLFAVERYSPIDNRWTVLSDAPFWCDHAMRLAGGAVLTMFGGTPSSLYEPSTDTWTRVRLPVERGPVASAPLADGRALLAGGRVIPTPEITSAVELFDPATKTFATVASMSTARSGALAVRLADGKILVAGGSNAAGNQKTAEIYDPSTNSWSPTGTMPFITYPLRMQLLSTGKVFLLAPQYAQTFDPTTSTWAALSFGATVITPVSGSLYLASGRLYDASTGSVMSITNLGVRSELGAAPLGGRVLWVGGKNSAGATLASAQIFAQLPLGAACGAAGDCVSSACVDGVCCDQACTAACKACALPGKVGTCSNVDGLPVAGHPIAPDTARCEPYATCVAGACASSCSVDTECTSGAFCSPTGCLLKMANGSSCADSRECQNGHCVDGTCCNSACKDQCAACDLPGRKGSCSPTTGAPRGSRPACAGIGFGTTCGVACNGVDVTQCLYPAAGAACSSASCASGSETHASTCDGKGACNDVPKSCAAYACGATTCNTTCASKTDCAPGFQCEGSACTPILGLGRACATADACASGACVDGVCCATASCAAGSSCATLGKKGVCAKSNGTACTGDAECGTGACVDGVCCESRCDRVCEACDAKGTEGKCAPVVGRPHGARPACPGDATDVCAAKQCDGETPASCEAFVTDVTCRPASCKDGVATHLVQCNGKGTCPASSQVSCGGALCDDATGDCKLSCASKADCASGYTCRDARCVRAARTCAADGESLAAADGTSTSCAPYVCRNDTCVGECAGTQDCAAGFTCDTDRKACLATVAQEDSSGGCVMGAPGTQPAAWCALLAGFAVLTARRRRAPAERRPSASAPIVRLL